MYSKAVGAWEQFGLYIFIEDVINIVQIKLTKIFCLMINDFNADGALDICMVKKLICLPLICGFFFLICFSFPHFRMDLHPIRILIMDTEEKVLQSQSRMKEYRTTS